MRSNRRCFPKVLAAVVLVLAGAAHAQPWPSKPIRVIVPVPPGGTMESMMRTVSVPLSKALGQPIIIENKPGAGTVIAVDAAAKATPDGYTFVLIGNSFAVNVTLVSKLPYDPMKDLQPVALMTRTANVLVAHPSVPAETLKEFVTHAKRNPGRITYASFGNGTSAHFAGEMFKAMAGIDMVHVPYKGLAPALTDTLGGQVNVMFSNLPEAVPHIAAGRLKAYGTTYKVRATLTPELPTIAEQGYPDFETDSWYGLLAPAGVSRDIVARVNAEVNRALATPDMHATLVARGLDPTPGSVERMSQHLQAEIAKYARIVKESNMKID